MRHLLSIVSLLVILLAPRALQGQTPVGWYLTGNFGIANVGSTTGLELALGTTTQWSNLLGFAMLDATLTSTEESRYYWDTFSNGQQRCRDSETGRFASSSLCNGTQGLYALMLDIDYAVPHSIAPVFIGAGYRIGEGSTPYGSVGYVSQPVDRLAYWFAKASVGQDFVQVHLGGSIKMR